MIPIAHDHVIVTRSINMAKSNGYTDWILPDKDTLLVLANSGFVSDRDRYWSSTPANETLAYSVCFDTKQQIVERRTKDLCVRCVRG